MNIQAAPPSAASGSKLETSDKKPRTLGIIVLIITFGVFGVWAAVAPLDSASNAPGVVVVKGKRKTVQHFEGGIVKEILVSEGELVQQGQSLVILDDTQFRGEYQSLQGQYFSAKALEVRLAAERDDQSAVDFPTVLDVDEPRAKEAKKNQIQVFDARKNAREGEKEVLEQRIAQYESQLQGLEALVFSQSELIESYQSEIEDLTALLDEGFVEKTRLVELQRNLVRARGEIADQKASMARTKVQIGETRLEILQLNKRFKTEVVDQLAKVQTEVFELEERLNILRDRVERTVIKAPVAGKVLGMNAHTIGGVFNGGTPILDIVPEDQELIIDAKVPPIDIDRVHAGLEARIRFSAFKKKTTPVITGIVTKISPDRLTDEETGNPYYGATIEVTPEGLEMLGDLELVAGMPADVLIKTGERTLLQYLTQPARDALATSLIED